METTKNMDKLKNTENKQSMLNIPGFVPDFLKP